PDPLVDLHSFPTRRSSDLSEVNPGNNPWTLSATFAGSDRTTCDLPYWMAFRMRRAARATSIDSKGALSARLNHVNSASCRPLNVDRKSTRLNSSHGSISYA